jgi:hypothetical protein
MRHAALAEEALLARETAVDELVDDDEMPGRQLLLQAADRGQRQTSVTPTRFSASILAR